MTLPKKNKKVARPDNKLKARSPSELPPKKKLETLKNSDLFSGFPDSTLECLIKYCKEIRLGDEKVLFEEGSRDNSMYVILEGKVLVYKLRKTISLLGVSDYFGEMSLIDNMPRAASARAVGGAVLLEIDNEFFYKYILTEPEAVLSMMSTLIARVRYNLELVSSEHQRLNCLVHDIKNYLLPISISENLFEETFKLLLGTEELHHKRKGADVHHAGIEKMVSVRNNLISLIDQGVGADTKGKSRYVKAPADIVKLAQETAEEVSCHKYLLDKTVVVNKPSGEIKKIAFNALDVKRVLQNLIINAGHASEKKGQIEISIVEKPDAVQVSVADCGMGVPDDVKPLLLKEIYTSKSDGNGLGLLSCKKIIEEYHQGKLGFESKWGKGATFHFTIPR